MCASSSVLLLAADSTVVRRNMLTASLLSAPVLTSFFHRNIGNFFSLIDFTLIVSVLIIICLQCFDAVGWAAGRASGL